MLTLTFMILVLIIFSKNGEYLKMSIADAEGSLKKKIQVLVFSFIYKPYTVGLFLKNHIA